MTLSQEIQLAQSLGLSQHFVMAAKLHAAELLFNFNPSYRSPREKVSALQKELREECQYLGTWKIRFLQQSCPLWFSEMVMARCYENIDKMQREIRIIKMKRHGAGHKSYDIEVIKKIPIDTITEIMPNRFFKNNPFRTENSPSNSLYWYPKENRCMDFATSKSYDVIDVYSSINKVDTKTAMRELSKMA